MQITMNNQSKTLFKSVIYILIFQLIWGLLNFTVNGEKNIQNNFKNKFLRKNNYFTVRKLSQKVDCDRDSFNNCMCPGNCMTHRNNNSYCVVKNCYKWNKDDTKSKGSCEQIGHEHIAPLVLSAIPFTSVMGIGYAVIKRWDLFGMQLGVLLGPCFILICCCCCFTLCKKSDDDELGDTVLCGDILSRCFSCCWGVALLVLWILSIVWVATPGGILDGDGCSLIF